ncbi:hypothetical protein [Acidisoma cladoniae]|uniref:hypothetical protein n=1 Tax=Acidisoma cladoniae TaxID=3040935 RepID=UPI00254F3B0D|nr:hypothetical protein [Acidisoma sp. PAMC 29798]
MFPLPEGEDGAWIASARRLPNFVCDAVFRIEPSFYVGPANGMTALEWETANVRLPPLNLPRQFADRVTTSELLGQEGTLADHYRRLITIADAHAKTASLTPFPYFRTQPAIIVNDEVVTEFSWNDDMHETSTILEIFADSSGGAPRLLHWDVDQGWQIMIVATESETCFIEWDGEGPPPPTGGYAVESAALTVQARAALDRLRTNHDRLVQEFGQDYWTYRPPPSPVRPVNRWRSFLGRLLSASRSYR